MMKFLVAVALALSVGACESQWQKAYGPGFPGPKEGMAAIYVVRDAAPEGPPVIDITMSQLQVGTLTSLSWVRLDVAPDPYDLRAYGPAGSTELIVTVLAGETRFLLAQPTESGNAQLRSVGWAEGRRIVRAASRTAEPR